MRTVFCSIPSYLFYRRGEISAHILSKGDVPINPYMNFDYNLLNSMEKEIIRKANDTLAFWCDEVVVFTDNPLLLPNGVQRDLACAKKVSLRLLPSFEVLETPSCMNSIAKEGMCRKESHHYPIVYTAISKHLFYYKMFISKFVLLEGAIPLNPFMLFDYFIMDAVDRKRIYAANAEIIKRVEELWVFGPMSDGIYDELVLARAAGKKTRYFTLENSSAIHEIEPQKVAVEEELKEQFVHLVLQSTL
jgi:hypothetical protein